MPKIKFSMHKLLVKLSIITLSIYIIIFSASMIATAILFISLNNYKERIERFILQKTNFIVDIEGIHTKFNNNYLPELTLDNISISKIQDPKQQIKLKQINLVLSYSSIWNLNLIFKNINIANTNISLEYLPNKDILINGIIINNTTTNIDQNKKYSFDLEKWLLKQENINLQNIKLSFWDKKNNLPEFSLKNINLEMNNNIFGNHLINLNISNSYNKNTFVTKLNWNGGRIEDYSHWKNANLQIQTYDDKNLFSKKFGKYLPNLKIMNEYSAKTALNANMKNGILTSLYADFDISNFCYNLDKNKHVISFPNIGAKINIELNEKTNTYKINAQHLRLLTSDGYLIDNKQIIGFYTINKKGLISVSDTNLKNLNNILPNIEFTKDIAITGKLNLVAISWNGNIFNPTNYTLNTNFINIGLKSKNKNIPSINNISGSLNINKESGTLSLNLKNSKFDYKQMFYVPYQIKEAQSILNWQKKQDQTVIFNLSPTKIHAIDFNLNTYGRYIYNPNNKGYLELYAYLDKLKITKVGYYLPIEIDSANQWLQTALKEGYTTNAKLTLKGSPDEIPFKNGKGIFYIDADVENGKLLYAKGWPTIDNIFGKFIIRNQKISITTNKATVKGNYIENAYAEIPDMTANYSYLIAKGKALGSTNNFINFLKSSPINQIINKLPEKLITKGNGKANLYLKVPFVNPENTIVDGEYIFDNNDVIFDLPVPMLHNVNGTLNFTNNSISTNQITTNILGANALLKAKTNKEGVIHFDIHVNKLNYNNTIKFYLPTLAPIINGFANTLISIDLTNQGIKKISATSDLEDVTINAPLPLHKEAKTKKHLLFDMLNSHNNSFKINFNYSNLLLGNILLNNKGNIVKAKLNIGDIPNNTNKTLKGLINIQSNFNNFYFIDWVNTISNITNSNKDIYPVYKKSDKINQDNKYNKINNNISTFPIILSLYTNNFYISQTNLGNTYATTYITPNTIEFNLNNELMSGYGTYQINQNNLILYLNYFNIYNNVQQSQQDNSKESYIAINYAPELEYTTIESINFNQLFAHEMQKAKDFSILERKTTSIPNTTINAKKIYYNNNDIGNLNLYTLSQKSNIIIESSNWVESYSKIEFSGASYCINCSFKKSLVDIKADIKTSNLGKSLDNLKFNDILEGGNGNIHLHTQWHGGITNFNFKSIASIINIDINNGKFLKVDTGTILGSIIGIISLQSIVNLLKFNFSSIFSNGFTFNTFTTKAYLLNNQLYLKYLYMSSTLAEVGLKGFINLNNNALDLYLSITPHVGIGVAVGVAIITVNPFVGVATYIAELLLKNPVNKLFAFSFHITGTVKNPNIEQIGASKQIQQNLTSTVK